MSAQIIPFRKDARFKIQNFKIRDLEHRELKLDDLTEIIKSSDHKQPSTEDLLWVHKKIRLLLAETFAQAQNGKRPFADVDPVIRAYDYFHCLCSKYGVNPETIADFNQRRDDWQRYAPMRPVGANW